MDRVFTVPINRVYLCNDEQDNIYVAFIGAPFLQKYDSRGKLVFEKWLSSPAIDSAVEEFRTTRIAPTRKTFFREDSVSIPNVVTGIAASGERVFISVSWRRSWIYVTDKSGDSSCVFVVPDDWGLRPHNIYASPGGILYAPNQRSGHTGEIHVLRPVLAGQSGRVGPAH
jgi:hypothetical protein